MHVYVYSRGTHIICITCTYTAADRSKCTEGGSQAEDLGCNTPDPQRHLGPLGPLGRVHQRATWHAGGTRAGFSKRSLSVQQISHSKPMVSWLRCSLCGGRNPSRPPSISMACSQQRTWLRMHATWRVCSYPLNLACIIYSNGLHAGHVFWEQRIPISGM